MGRENTKNSILPPYYPSGEKADPKPKDGLIKVKEYRSRRQYTMPRKVFKRDSADQPTSKNAVVPEKQKNTK